MQKSSPRSPASARPSRRSLQSDRRERLVLRQFETAAARKLERSKEARREARTAELRILGRGKEALEEGPVERGADHLAHALDRFIESHHRPGVYDVHCRLGSRADHAIGGEQVEIAKLPGGIAHEAQSFG